jgi:PAS domain-containing protein
MVELSGYSAKSKKTKSTSKKTGSKKFSKPPSKTAEACHYDTLNRDMLESILENIPSAVIVIVKPKGKIVFVNSRTVELHGINPCGLEFEKHAKDLKIFDLNKDIYPTKELYSYRALNR